MNLLMLGAGFSRNWGGWLASEAFTYLLGCPEVKASEDVKTLLWETQQEGGFEQALAILKERANQEPARYGEQLAALNRAVAAMFVDMNYSYRRFVNFEPVNHAGKSVRRFLARFDAIFTLNQDLLLEEQYLELDVSLLSNRRVHGSDVPGMKPVNPNPPPMVSRWAAAWEPRNEADFGVAQGTQPFFKLHGSSNWHAGADQGDSMLIMGGNKAHEIGLSPVLRWYQEQFAVYMASNDTRLMVIGYGYRDYHINTAIEHAVFEHGLKFFNVSPSGADQGRKVAKSVEASGGKSNLERLFQVGLIGASERSLQETFGEHDNLEYKKLERFFVR
ncbi:SIR2 family protein [Burkholderia sp. R-69980]|nr:SIR2 family protein [Burkholderia sp. R-69980]